jgi:hypothetical protein
MAFEQVISDKSFYLSETAGAFVLQRIISKLFTVLSQYHEAFPFKDEENCRRAALFLVIMKRIRSASTRHHITHDEPFPDIMIRSQDIPNSPLLIKFSEQLQEDLKQRDEEECIDYRVETQFEGITKGLYPVSIVVKKEDKIIAFVEIGEVHQYRFEKDTGNKNLRRVHQLYEFLYRQQYRNVPFIRVDLSATEGKDIQIVSKGCLTQIVPKQIPKKPTLSERVDLSETEGKDIQSVSQECLTQIVPEQIPKKPTLTERVDLSETEGEDIQSVSKECLTQIVPEPTPKKPSLSVLEEWYLNFT